MTRSSGAAALAVLGGGPRGAHLAGLAARAGFAVHLLEPDPFAAARAADTLTRAGLALPVLGDAAGLPGMQLALEAEAGQGMARAEVLAAAMATLPAGTVLVTTAPDPDFAALAARLPAPGLVAGLDLYMERPGVRLAEVLEAPGAAPEATAAAEALARALGRVPLRVVGGQGAGASLRAAARGAALWLAASGAVPAEADAALVDWGYALGPFAADDLAGLDLVAPAQPLPGAPGKVLPRMLAEGRLGKKAAVGWYRYPGGGGAVADPLIEDLLAEEAHFARHPRRTFAAEEIVARVTAAQVAAATRLLAAGATAAPEMLDRISVAGCGFPAARGGIVAWARREAGELRAALARFGPDAPSVWEVPSGALDRLLDA
ncbi:MAG: hypothetical protein CVT80_08140 [Alphaproteobacteria bacterium HGW-Alphaproteobacteria-2]|nr:MAG: hypothetical protein CVT80_08140 [Alphaproteobacteria bacterium HGW-Alphaproteobacteria-2]